MLRLGTAAHGTKDAVTVLPRGASPLAAVLNAAVGVVMVAALAATAGVVLVLVLEHVSVSTNAVLASTTIAVAMYPLVKRMATHSFDPFEPIVAASVILALLFGIRPLSMMITEAVSYRGLNIESQLTTSTVLGLLGTLAFVVAYESLIRIRQHESPRRRRRHVHPNTVYLYAIIVSILGFVLFAVHLSIGGSVVETAKLLASGRSETLADLYSNSSEYLSAAPILVAVGGIVTVIAAGRRVSKAQFMLVLLAIAFPVVVFFLIGNRRFIIPSIAIPVVAYYLAVHRRPSAKQLLLIVPIAFVVLATIPFARSSGAQEQAGGSVPLYRQGFASPVDSWKRFITGPDTNMFSALAVEVEVLSETSDFAYGRATLGDLVLAPIPSRLFPGKPVTARNEMLGKAFGGPCRSIGGVCDDFSVIGTFYQDFWYAGVVAGMVLLGAGSAWIWRRYLAAKGDPFTVLLGATWTVFLPIIIRAGFMPSFAWFLYFLLPSLLGLWLAKATNGAPPGLQEADI